MSELQLSVSPVPLPGLFISFEGGERVGKSTQIGLLCEHLTELGYEVVSTREPGGTPLGSSLRHLVQHGPDDVNAKAEALIYAADRSYHVATKIRPALQAGKIVVTDRYLDSSLAYQGGGRGLGEAVRSLSLWATDGLLPNLTVLLDANPTRVKARREEDSDRLEREPDDFHFAVRERFLELAAQAPERFVVIDATDSREEIAKQIWAHVSRLLQELDSDRVRP
ncbi:dTMP kinase [Actinomycetaceae bacterium TAE3-ERU4]|nr:dTMP kinase [Actinomycetaceae bacterium TAE3-ERU4]